MCTTFAMTLIMLFAVHHLDGRSCGEPSFDHCSGQGNCFTTDNVTFSCLCYTGFMGPTCNAPYKDSTTNRVARTISIIILIGLAFLVLWTCYSKPEMRTPMGWIKCCSNCCKQCCVDIYNTDVNDSRPYVSMGEQQRRARENESRQAWIRRNQG